MIDFECTLHTPDDKRTVDFSTNEPELLLQGLQWEAQKDCIHLMDASGEHLGNLRPTYDEDRDEKLEKMREYFEETFEDNAYQPKYEYVVMIPNYWGKGKTLGLAVDNCLDQCKTDNHRLNMGQGCIRAFLGHGMYVNSYGGVGGRDVKELPEEEVRTAWGEGLRDLLSANFHSTQEFINQFKVTSYHADRTFTELDEKLTEAICSEFPENYDIPHTLPPKPRLKVPQYVKDCETPKLKEWYLNAKATQSCGGHRKGQRNDELVALYTQELQDREEELPEGEGTFNGEGSS